ncbi:MAG: BadF/BadG/BcrA/BcrD ATPase family protein [Rhodothermales bacterium]
MAHTHPAPPTAYVGIDAGGSKTTLVARLGHDETTDVTLAGPAANPYRVGVEEAARVMAELTSEALQSLPEAAAVSVCAGVAGAGRPDDQESLTRYLRRELSGPLPLDVRVVHDGVIALEGAFDGGSGLIVIAGTGSLVLARTEAGAVVRSGGWGYLFGDEGSGHALGTEGLRAVASALDGGPDTSLSTLLSERHDITTAEDLVQRVYREGWPVQHVAPLVIEAATEGDAVAHAILQDQTARLAAQVAWTSGRCDAITPRIAFLGGLTNEAPYNAALAAALGKKLPAWRVEKARHAPVYGALRLALHLGDRQRIDSGG